MSEEQVAGVTTKAFNSSIGCPQIITLISTGYNILTMKLTE
jgi:hypothetical protein